MRFARNRAFDRRQSGDGRLTVGFVPTIDCATLVVAQELGLFRAQGLEVTLSREVGWATVREKLLHEELDAAVAHASLLFSIYFGLGGVRRPCLTGLMLGHHGSAITISRACWTLGARDPLSLAELVRKETGRRRFTFGVVLEYSAQHFLLAEWLSRGGIRPGIDVDLVVVPSALVHRSLRAGHLDGYCVAEPWNSSAALAGDGVVLASSAEICPGHPDKALVVMQDLADRRVDEHERLLAALIEAGEYCAAPENRDELIHLLARPAWLGVEVEILRNAMVGPFKTGAETRSAEDLIRFDVAASGAPSRAQGRWVLDSMLRLATEEHRGQLRPESIRRVFREEVHAAALRRARLPKNASGADRVPAARNSGPMRISPATNLDQTCLSIVNPTGVLV